MNPEQKYIILLGLAITIKHLHEKGIYLISLHPKNILLNEKYYPMISDFTISKYTRRKVEQKKIELNDFKSDPYLAPESFENDIFNESSNAYSFALIAFRLLSNKPLFVLIIASVVANVLRLSAMSLKSVLIYVPAEQ